MAATGSRGVMRREGVGKEERDLADPPHPRKGSRGNARIPVGLMLADNTEGIGITSLFRGVIFMIHGFIQVIGGWL